MACIAAITPVQLALSQTAAQPFNDASTFIHTYMQQWSSPNAEALSYMNTVFPDKAIYFNQSLFHGALMQAKRRFAERWPLRRFVVRDEDLSISCDQPHLCTAVSVKVVAARNLQRLLSMTCRFPAE